MAKIIEITCPQCNGSKQRNYGKGLEDCRYCGGQGTVKTIDQSK